MTEQDGRVRIPADVDQPDRILAGLTARQLAILAVAAAAGWGLYWLASPWVPPTVFAAAVAPLAAAAALVATGRRDGLALDRLLVAALRQRRAARRLVPAPEGVEPPPAWLSHADEGPAPAPLGFPARGLAADGAVDLGEDGSAVVCQTSSLNFGLRTVAEQQALVAAFGRCLNAVTGPVQVLVRAERADLRDTVRHLEDAAPGLPHPALEAAAREHAAFLASLAARRDVLARHVLVVLHDANPAEVAGQALFRRAEELTGGLAAAGVTVSVLDGDAAAATLAAAARPAGDRPAGLAGPDDLVTGGLR